MNRGMAKKRILIIEDEKPILEAEAMLLESDYEVFKASDGKSGFELAKKHKPDLVVLDLMLPHRGGYDLCFSFRQDPTLKKAKILMVTALSQDIDKVKGKMVGMDDYLTKPYEPSLFLEKVRKLLS
ncbi:MAG: response regulator [Nanoarchaeota archaeon]|nr:response regulator [Nanoarchaeota archaeon]